MRINEMESDSNEGVAVSATTTSLPHTNILSAPPLVPCPSPVTLAVSKKPFVTHRNPPSPSPNVTMLHSSTFVQNDDKGSGKASTMSGEELYVDVSPRVLDDSDIDEGSDADVEEDEDIDDLLELELKLQVHSKNFTPKKERQGKKL